MKYLLKWVILTVLFAWGFLSFILLAGEEDHANPLPLFYFLAVKAAALVSLILCVVVGVALNEVGLLPKVPEE